MGYFLAKNQPKHSKQGLIKLFEGGKKTCKHKLIHKESADKSYIDTCKTTAVDDKARPLPMTIDAGPGSPETKRAIKPTATAVTRTCNLSITAKCRERNDYTESRLYKGHQTMALPEQSPVQKHISSSS